jgi:chemotaxis protein MotB
MRDRPKRKAAEEESDTPSSPAWMATFADMMTLLMCFFILIMSFSTMEVTKFKLAMGSLRGAFGILGTQKELRPEQSWFSPFQPNPQNMAILDHMDKVQDVISNNQMEDKVDMYLNDGEMVIRIKDRLLFDPGSARLKPDYLRLLKLVKDLLFEDAKEVRVEGHTDPSPVVSDTYPSNWELSMARALSVVRFYIQHENLDPSRISAAGYGENRPIASNDTPENRAKNRRVEIKLKF